MSQNTVNAFAKHNPNLASPQVKTLWDELISLMKEGEEDLRQAYDDSQHIENVLSFIKPDVVPNALAELSKALLFFVENHFGQLKSNKIFLRIVKQYVNVVKASKDAQVIVLTNTIIKTISSEKEQPKKAAEMPAEPAVQMWSSKESLFKIIADKVPRRSKFLEYFEKKFNDIKNSYTIFEEENFESYFVRKFLITAFNDHAFSEMDTFMDLGKINVNMPFDLHEDGDNQITLAHTLAQFLDCNDCYHLARRFINRINFKAVDKAGNTFMHHAVMSQWEHDLKPFIKRSDLTIRNKKGMTCVDLDKSMVKKNSKSVFS